MILIDNKSALQAVMTSRIPLFFFCNAALKPENSFRVNLYRNTTGTKTSFFSDLSLILFQII
ncbi:hypothetical protein BpHYR1_018257 [Brachionus plicatilis]|uniref:Uncharacterized protein n=1 Tax=Brachionus plicatilis TaxID=10195 RepID=A0A3M7RVU6_BRAPC|nr:hypothetical protein BpHYR1_018257 [Brachionus plicatilis]